MIVSWILGLLAWCGIRSGIRTPLGRYRGLRVALAVTQPGCVVYWVAATRGDPTLRDPPDGWIRASGPVHIVRGERRIASFTAAPGPLRCLGLTIRHGGLDVSVGRGVRIETHRGGEILLTTRGPLGHLEFRPGR